MATILHIGDEPSVGLLLDELLASAGHRARSTASVTDALRLLSTRRVDLVVSDVPVAGLTGLEILSLLRREGHDVPLIMLVDGASLDRTVIIKAGAIDCLAKPVTVQQLDAAVERALEFARLTRENEALRREVTEVRLRQQIIGESRAIRELLGIVANTAALDGTVLLQGESGTGKEMVARAIHDRSERRAGPFVKLHCATPTGESVARALFGHERGAFHGAGKRAAGALDHAHGGTLLLDEISALESDVQAKLVGVLRERELERIGGAATPLDVRVIATTSADPSAHAVAGALRRELFDALRETRIVIPPLRDRVEDIPLLASRFAMGLGNEIGKQIDGISVDALAMLAAYRWPGNVRELRHVVERAVILTREALLEPYAFDGLQGRPPRPGEAHRTAPRRVPGEPGTAVANGNSGNGSSGNGSSGNGSPANGALPHDGVVLTSLNIDDAERALIARALEVAKHNRTRTAALLGISVRTLRNKLNGPRRIELA